MIAGLFFFSKAPPKKAVLSRTQLGEGRMQDRDGQVPTGEEAVSRLKVVVVEEGGWRDELGRSKCERGRPGL
jgi:hypothetical protein